MRMFTAKPDPLRDVVPVYCEFLPSDPDQAIRNQLELGNTIMYDPAYLKPDILKKDFNLKTRHDGYLPKIEKVLFNDPATIVFWKDGTKTVVKVQDGDEYDPEIGLTVAITKKALGNKGSYYNEIKKWTDEYTQISDAFRKFNK